MFLNLITACALFFGASHTPAIQDIEFENPLAMQGGPILTNLNLPVDNSNLFYGNPYPPNTMGEYTSFTHCLLLIPFNSCVQIEFDGQRVNYVCTGEGLFCRLHIRVMFEDPHGEWIYEVNRDCDGGIIASNFGSALYVKTADIDRIYPVED